MRTRTNSSPRSLLLPQPLSSELQRSVTRNDADICHSAPRGSYPLKRVISLSAKRGLSLLSQRRQAQHKIPRVRKVEDMSVPISKQTRRPAVYFPRRTTMKCVSALCGVVARISRSMLATRAGKRKVRVFRESIIRIQKPSGHHPTSTCAKVNDPQRE